MNMIGGLQQATEYIFEWFFVIGNISLQFSCCKFYNVSSIFVSLMSLITFVTISVWSQICYNFSIFSTPKKNHIKSSKKKEFKKNILYKILTKYYLNDSIKVSFEYFTLSLWNVWAGLVLAHLWARGLYKKILHSPLIIIYLYKVIINAAIIIIIIIIIINYGHRVYFLIMLPCYMSVHHTDGRPARILNPRQHN